MRAVKNPTYPGWSVDRHESETNIQHVQHSSSLTQRTKRRHQKQTDHSPKIIAPQIKIPYIPALSTQTNHRRPLLASWLSPSPIEKPLPHRYGWNHRRQTSSPPTDRRYPRHPVRKCMDSLRRKEICVTPMYNRQS